MLHDPASTGAQILTDLAHPAQQRRIHPRPDRRPERRNLAPRPHHRRPRTTRITGFSPG
ncbi:hypothetical protein [Rhodococcus jostii]|uniref:hypothetical protein n=1 Tax=Rhodococcus jostii TaxID=132919 RepID=UPI001F075F31|nr:hypothetical protein [Rhodococcus jostii]